ncbi:hypothetical protein Tb927.5.3130 [Trypanosoma brucei brucei TREU927]|uniref:T. brucei spp.-specific protein n=1 Tax=Trypanosoma brucei brucei (strain 927/4 GUTat10.1) TaxID=185431 RepID=Q57Z80_TRYB2|nr:hypothetical protein Tb927.5.3130 [Trypanosoma brucei brucei TREU927]AAX79553.1 hypothetical protein Tb927.5.3130 [Trypanosoma brucei]AAZ11426.1 hypothetical protein Tb927.5.3130 [Trypanosoma brucei brucei TREU927]
MKNFVNANPTDTPNTTDDTGRQKNTHTRRRTACISCDAGSNFNERGSRSRFLLPRLSSVDEKSADSKSWKGLAGMKLPTLTTRETHSTTRTSTSNSRGPLTSPRIGRSRRESKIRSAESTVCSWGTYAFANELAQKKSPVVAPLHLPSLLEVQTRGDRQLQSRWQSEVAMPSTESQLRDWSGPSAWGLFANAKEGVKDVQEVTRSPPARSPARETHKLDVSDHLVLVSDSNKSRLLSTSIITCCLGRKTVELQQLSIQMNTIKSIPPPTNPRRLKQLSPNVLNVVAAGSPHLKPMAPKTPTKPKGVGREMTWRESSFRPLVPTFAPQCDVEPHLRLSSPFSQSCFKDNSWSGGEGSYSFFPLFGPT